jgi:hypothetical protein
MKSAYELAMERLQKQSPSAPLTAEQKTQIAEIDSLYRAKMAEKELLLSEQIRREEQAGASAEVDQLRQQLASEIRRLQNECEDKKGRVRAGQG